MFLEYSNRAAIIGDRIKKERKRLHLSQQELLQKVYLSEKSVASLRAWEHGKRLPDMDTLARMCEVVQCDFGYLVGDYDQKTIETNRIQQITGLTEPAIERLQKANRDVAQNFMDLPELNNILLSDDFWALLSDLWFFRYQCNAAETRPKMLDFAKQSGDKEALKRYAEDLRFAVRDKDVLRLSLQKHLFRIIDEIEKGAKPNGNHNKAAK